VTAQQTYPSEEVRLVVPQAAGGASDALARILASKLSDRWGHSVIVDNRVGANGNIGTNYVAKAAPNGYTLLLTYEGSYATSPALYANLPWDPARSFVSVAPVAVVPFVMVINSKLPARNLQELIALAKKRELYNASPGNGSLNHLLGERFNRAAGVKMMHVPYKGISQAMTDLLAGRVDVTFSSSESVIPYVKSGALRAIGVTSAKRSELMPGVPTLSELGLKDFDVNPWFGIVAPIGTPRDVVAKLNRDISEVLNSPDVKARFEAVGAVPLIMTPAAFDVRVKKDVASWSRVIHQAGIKID
jgi:tripartite-type tricarboxylate transporter receptor subunit TctC